MEPMVFEDAAAWDAWLAANHERHAEAWLKIAKKHSGVTTVDPAQAVEVALCYGWIDSQRRAHDETYFVQRYSRRRPGGRWSRINVERVEALTAAGRMRAAGIVEVEAAKVDGRWDAAYASQATATVPDDLAAALAADTPARTAFEALGRTSRYAVILQLETARTADLRGRRLAKVLALLREGGEIPPPTVG